MVFQLLIFSIINCGLRHGHTEPYIIARFCSHAVPCRMNPGASGDPKTPVFPAFGVTTGIPDTESNRHQEIVVIFTLCVK